MIMYRVAVVELYQNGIGEVEVGREVVERSVRGAGCGGRARFIVGHRR